ncbi:PaaI family thioesterase [Gramella sp. AN32]|uniref:PaaI family thioesterase n=1 Tax=Christiangramia antarctica TaxID=2058158 RepID=A0ABW5X5R3_9FLAO|nr:PaaI family thioesterase [Gramella sp. AN32]MCM4157812.1 thioesterase [Gramella sp. AN32]
MKKIPILEYIDKMISGNLQEGEKTYFNYPTPISNTLSIEIIGIKPGEAKLAINTNTELHGNQQGTIHGGLLCELADAAIGTAHSTIVMEGESFTSIDFKINFFRPVWNDRLTAYAEPINKGRTITTYKCDIFKSDGKLAASAVSLVMTLNGDRAKGR